MIRRKSENIFVNDITCPCRILRMRAYKEPIMYHRGNFSNMSRRMFRCYLVYYLFAAAILICGSSQRTPRRAFCSSCGRDYPEALVSPWYPRQESDLQDEIAQDFSVAPIQNLPYYHLAQREVSSRNKAHDDVFSSQNPISSRRFRSFSQQEPASGYLRAGALPSTRLVDKSEQQNSFRGNLPNKFAELSSKPTTLPLDKSMNNHPFARFSQFSGEPQRENSFFRNTRDEHSIFSSENDKDYAEHQEDPARKFNVVYRADTKPANWENSRHKSSSEIIVPRKSFPTFRPTSIPDEDEDEIEERGAIERFPNSISQQYNPASPPQGGYHSVGFGTPKAQREPHVVSQDFDMREPTKSDEVFDNWDFMKDSSEISNLGQSRSSSGSFYETYSVEEDEMIAAKDDNKQINYPYVSPQDSHIWRPTKDETVFPDYWDSATDNDSQSFMEINRLKETENNWPQVYPAAEDDVRYFDDEMNKDQEYFEDEIGKDITQTETSIFNPYILPSYKNIWRTTEDDKLPDKLGFMTRIGLQGIQKTGQPEIYPAEESNNEHFQNENKYTIQDEAHIDTDKIIRAPAINVTPYIFPQSLLNLLSTSKYPAEFSITDLTGTKDNILSVYSTEKRHELLKDSRVALDDERSRDQIFVKDTDDARKYNNFAFNRRPDIKDNTQNEALTELDPDLMDEIENPPTEPTEPTPRESFEKRSTSTVKDR